jgi:hypothetical protein
MAADRRLLYLGRAGFWRSDRPARFCVDGGLSSGGSAVPNPCPNVRDGGHGEKRRPYLSMLGKVGGKPLPATTADFTPER